MFRRKVACCQAWNFTKKWGRERERERDRWQKRERQENNSAGGEYIKTTVLWKSNSCILEGNINNNENVYYFNKDVSKSHAI